MRRLLAVGAVSFLAVMGHAPASSGAEVIAFRPGDTLMVSAKQLAQVEVAVTSVVVTPVEVKVEVGPSDCAGGGGTRAPSAFTLTPDQGRIEPLGTRVFVLRGSAPPGLAAGTYCAEISARVIATARTGGLAARQMRFTVADETAPERPPIAGIDHDGPSPYEKSRIAWRPTRPEPVVAIVAGVAFLGLAFLLAVAAHRRKLDMTSGPVLGAVTVVSLLVALAYVWHDRGEEVTIPLSRKSPPEGVTRSLVGPNGSLTKLVWMEWSITSEPLSTPGAYKTKLDLTPTTEGGVIDVTINVRTAALLAAAALAFGVAIAYTCSRWLGGSRGASRAKARALDLWEKAGTEAVAWTTTVPEPWAVPWTFASGVGEAIESAMADIAGEQVADADKALEAVEALVAVLPEARRAAYEASVALQRLREAHELGKFTAEDMVEGLLRPPSDLKPDVVLKRTEELGTWPAALDALAIEFPPLAGGAAAARKSLEEEKDADKRKSLLALVERLDASLKEVRSAATPTEVFKALGKATADLDPLKVQINVVAEKVGILRRRTAGRTRGEPQQTTPGGGALAMSWLGPTEGGTGSLAWVHGHVPGLGTGMRTYQWRVGTEIGRIFSAAPGSDGRVRVETIVAAGSVPLSVTVTDGQHDLAPAVSVDPNRLPSARSVARGVAVNDRVVFAFAAVAAVASGLASLYGPTWGGWSDWLAAHVWGASVAGGAKAVAAIAAKAAPA